VNLIVFYKIRIIFLRSVKTATVLIQKISTSHDYRQRMSTLKNKLEMQIAKSKANDTRKLQD
jgi:hypothetical protein